MYAVIKTGGKQYRVTKGQKLTIEKVAGDEGQSLSFDQVCMIADGQSFHVGQPTLAGAKVTAEIVEQGRHKKVEILKFKRRKHHMKRQGHRQWCTTVIVTDIQQGGEV